MAARITDIIISGGGLAGLSLALQLKLANANLKIIIIERNTFPIPSTTAKVGESTVEIGSHYLSEVLGLKDHLEQHHLRKFGLRCFFGRQTGDFSMLDELGVSQLFDSPSYQIERGTLENHLHALLTEKDVEIIDGATTLDISPGAKKHTLAFLKNDTLFSIQGRWLIDAAGRNSLLKQKLGLHQTSPHKGNAVFFRVDKTVLLDEWSDDQNWQNRIPSRNKRWLSTNHLMGPGYWVWVIPLASGATSFGIVFDNQVQCEVDLTSFEKCIGWLQQHHPECAGQLEGAKVLDFHNISNYAYGCKKYFSNDGWALIGEAGAFIDPFYSPGSDFIAIGNTLMSELIAQDYAGEDTQLNTAVFHAFYNSFVEHTLSLYQGQYGGFGDRQMMAVKLVWDYSYYWGVLAVMFIKGTLTDVMALRKINPYLHRANKLNQTMQALVRSRASQRKQFPPTQLFIDQHAIPCLVEFNRALTSDCCLSIEEVLQQNLPKMELLVESLGDMLKTNPSLTVSSKEYEVLGNYRLNVLG